MTNMIKQHQNAGERLHQNSVFAKRIDIATVAFMAALPVSTVTAGMVYLWDDPNPLWVRVTGAFIAGMIVAWPGVSVIASIGRALTDRLAPTWVIDSSKPHVVTINGTVPYMQWDAARSAMLKARSGYMLCDDALPQFGCILAAVPRSQ
jgi:hypothetical protein